MHPLMFTLLRRLGDAEFHSGEALALELDVTRATISNALRNAEQLGVQVYRVQGRGYQLARPIEWLDRARIEHELGGIAKVLTLDIVDHVTSTNTALVDRVGGERATRSGACLAAEWQSGGRGRRGRAWHAGLGESLTFSLVWNFEQGVAFVSGLSLAIGVALARALEACGAHRVQLKWPNDVLHDFHKLAGVLIELQGDVLGPSQAVIGIGVNVDLSERTRDCIDQAVTDVQSIVDEPLSRNVLFARVLAALVDLLHAYEREGFAPFREQWQARHAYHARDVRLTLPNGEHAHGRCEGVAQDGGLLLAGANGTQRYSVGEISLRAGKGNA